MLVRMILQTHVVLSIPSGLRCIGKFTSMTLSSMLLTTPLRYKSHELLFLSAFLAFEVTGDVPQSTLPRALRFILSCGG